MAVILKNYFFIVMTVLIAVAGVSYGRKEKCKLRTVSKPIEWAQYTESYRYTFRCVFTSTCRPRMSFHFNPYPNDIHEEYKPDFSNEFLDVNSWKYRILAKMSFDLDFSRDGNQYTAIIVVDPFKYQYAGRYRCIISDPRDPGNELSETFTLEVVQLGPLYYVSQCFLRRAQNITAIPHYLSDGSLKVTLFWDLSVKEDPDLEYCEGARGWKVRILKYSNVAAAPGDYEVREESSVKWINVDLYNTSYSFSEKLVKNMYYSFQVGHRRDLFSITELQTLDIKPQTFASQLYYFGLQEPTVISSKLPNNIIKLHAGSSRSVACTVTGFPPPSIDWVRVSASPPVYSRKNNSAVLNLNHVTEMDAGDYFCVAFNVIVNPPKGRRDQPDSWKISVIVENQDALKNGSTCNSISMESSICKDYIYNGLKIFTNHSTIETSIARENRALSLTAKVNYEVPVGKCRDLAHSMMCHIVYPYCGEALGEPTPHKLCSSVCEEFITGSCSGLLSEDSSVYELIMEGCDNKHINSGGDSPECVPLSFQAFRNDHNEPIVDTGDCVRGDGRGYSGNTYRTESGDLCQMWSKQTPHPHPMLPELYRSDLDLAEFFCRNPGGIGTKPWCYTNNPAVRWGYCDIPQCDSCEIYTGETCMRVEGYSNMNVTVRKGKRVQSLETIEDKISLFSKSILFMQPTEGCKDIIRVLLCHGAFPQCTETASKQLCATHCKLHNTLMDLCPDVYKEYSNFLSLNGDFMSEMKCNTEGDQCMTVSVVSGRASVTQAAPETLTSTCYEGTGLSYNGTVSQTRGGLQCQPWDVQQPHSHSTTPSMYPVLYNSENYCRNPGDLLDKPWCYTTSEKTVWDYCDIPACSFRTVVMISEDPVSVSDPPETLTKPSGNRFDIKTLIAAAFVIFVILAVLTIVALSLCYVFTGRKNRKARAMNVNLSKITNEAFRGEKYVTNKEYTKVVASNKSQSLIVPENFKLLDSKDIKYVSQLGQGNFGIVFKGKAFGIKEGEEGDEEGIDVAVKTLKEEASSEVKEDFIDEAKLMFTFDHPNILKIHGVCMNEMPYQLVFEYMDEGDLTRFLRARASSQQRRLINPFKYRSRTESSFSDDPASLTKTQLLYICKQIADGMKYLAETKYIHRDLACRNCLIKSDLVVKIGDFGMSRNLYSKDYYRINGIAVLPVRWMSPESLIYGKFSVEGDVWSYGVVMWEVFSYALQPYYGISNEEVTEAIRRGKTLNRPDDCPTGIYQLMKECWAIEPADRITFSELYESLSALHQRSSCHNSFGEKFTDDELSDSSEMPSDTFYSEEHLDKISNEVEIDL